MNCPNCGTKLCFCEFCKSMDNILTENKDTELFICKGCKFIRPLAWWNALELDIKTKIEWTKEVVDEEELPDEISGHCESPWCG